MRVRLIVIITIGVILIGVLVEVLLSSKSSSNEFTDHFGNVSDDSLLVEGWQVKAKDANYWSRKNEHAGELTLFTLNGDNWPDPAQKAQIKNLLIRKINSDCFTAEVHLKNFIPLEEWQQAGMLLLEDTTFNGKSVRMSLAFNDYFGGYPKPKEILIQAITSLGNGFGKPEEIAHRPIFYVDSLNKNALLYKNLENSALRIEKHGKKFRFLYAYGQLENSAFKEISSQEFDLQPKYIALFAIKGFKKNGKIIPARFTYFKLTGESCSN